MKALLKYKYLLLILFLALLLRVIWIGSVPPSLYIDEVAIKMDALSVAQTGTDIHGRPWYQLMYPSYGDYKQPVYIWITAAMVKLFGSTDLIIKLPSILAGVGTVLLTHLLVKKLFLNDKKSKLYALCSAFVVAISPWSVIFSRAAFEGHLAQFFLLAAVISYISSFKQKSWLVLAVAFGVLSTYSYYSVRFVFPGILIVIGVVMIGKQLKDLRKVHFKESARSVGLYLLIPLLTYLLLILPMTQTEFYVQSNQFRLSTESILNSFDPAVESNQLRQVAGNTAIDRLVFHRHWLLVRALLENYSDNLSPSFIFLYGDPNLRHGTGASGLFLFSLLPFFLAGLFELLRKRKDLLLVLMCWWLIALLPASVPEETPHALRSLNALVPISVVIGYGLVVAFTAIKEKLSNSLSRAYSLIIPVILLINLIMFFYHYFVIYPQQSAQAWFSSFSQMATVIDEERRPTEIVYYDLTDKFFLWLIAYRQDQTFPLENVTEGGFIITQFNDYRHISDLTQVESDGNSSLLVISKSDQQVLKNRYPLAKELFTAYNQEQPERSLVLYRIEEK